MLRESVESDLTDTGLSKCGREQGVYHFQYSTIQIVAGLLALRSRDSQLPFMRPADIHHYSAAAWRLVMTASH